MKRPFFAPFLAPCAALAVLAVTLGSGAASASDLVGPESCRTCHQEAWQAWSQSAHARAATALDAESRKKPLCLQCHSRDEARPSQVPVSGVSCETCHGAGRWYQPSVVMRDKELSHLFGLTDPTAQSCMACHGGETPSLKPFDVKEALPRIDHWTADRAARKKAGRSDARKAAPKSMLATWLKGSP